MALEIQSTKLPRTVCVNHCPVCGDKGRAFLASVRDYLFGVVGTYNYQQCKSCDTVFQSPMVGPEDLPLCYPENYYTHQPTNDKSGNIHLIDLIEKESKKSLRGSIRYSLIKAMQKTPQGGLTGTIGRLFSLSRKLRERAFFDVALDELLPRKEKPGKALEIGCGGGQMLATLQRLNWKVTGVEWDKNAVSTARGYGTIKVHEGDFRKIDLPLENYQLIFMNHVFEHIEDPIGAMRRLRELLAPDGKVVLACPNPTSIGSKLYKNYWPGFDPPRHLVLLPPSAYKIVAKKTGLKVISVRSQCAFVGLWFIVTARESREGKELNRIKLNLQTKDSLLYRLERAAINLGLNVGEEVIVVLEMDKK